MSTFPCFGREVYQKIVHVHILVPLCYVRVSRLLIGFLFLVQNKKISLRCSQNIKFQSIALHRN